MAKIKVNVEKTATGFSAYAEKYSAFTTGKTVAELVTNMVESVNLYFEEAKIQKAITPNDLLFEMDLTSVFDVFPVITFRKIFCAVRFKKRNHFDHHGLGSDTLWAGLGGALPAETSAKAGQGGVACTMRGDAALAK